jgi:hypothetical protein
MGQRRDGVSFRPLTGTWNWKRACVWGEMARGQGVGTVASTVMQSKRAKRARVVKASGVS